MRAGCCTFPRGLTSLSESPGHLRVFCGNGATGADALTLIASLTEAGHLSIGEKDVVTYTV